VKVGFDAPAGDMNQQPGKQDLSNRNDMSGHFFARCDNSQIDRQAGNGTAQQHGKPQVVVQFTV
jgi:anti-sigma factor RsiW